MEAAEYRNIYKNENSHFYYRFTHQLIENQLKEYLSDLRDQKLRILDAGCGTGLLAKKLSKYGEVKAVDFHPQAVLFSKKRGVKARKASITNLPYRDGAFDILVSVDVLYHKMVDDKRALSEFLRVLKPGGIMVIRVPAMDHLKPVHDEYVHTRQRYRKSELQRKIIKSGFALCRITYINALLYPVALVSSLIERLHPPKKIGSTIKPLPPVVNGVALWLLSLELYLLRLINLPFGIGLLVIATKPLSVKRR